MTYQELLAYCLAKPGAWIDRPFGDYDVTKVDKKIFAYFNEEPPSVTLKGDPLEVEFLRKAYPTLTPPPAYLSKSAYNVVPLDGSVPDAVIRDMVDASYALVYGKLTRAQKQAIEAAAK